MTPKLEANFTDNLLYISHSITKLFMRLIFFKQISDLFNEI